MQNNVIENKTWDDFIEFLENKLSSALAPWLATLEPACELFEKAKFIVPLKAEKTGYISKIDAKTIGQASVHLGAGREKKEDSIDYSVGIVLNKKVSDYVEEGEVLLYIHSNDELKVKEALNETAKAYEIVENNVDVPKEILGIER